MTISEPGEMNRPVSQPITDRPEPSSAAPLGKFDMHIQVSKLSQDTLDDLIIEFGIPRDLNPILPPSGLTMDRLPENKIGIYVHQLKIGGVRVPFSTFLLSVIDYFRVHISQLIPIGLNRVTLFELRCYSLNVNPTVPLFRVFYRLCKQGSWFSFESRTGKRAKKCFEEILSGLKHWKDHFFLIDRRAIPHAMPWRHKDSKISDPFPENYSEADARKLASKLIYLRKPPTSLLWMTGLSSVFKNPGHEVVLRDAEGHGNLKSLLYCLTGFSVPLFFCIYSVLTLFSLL